MEETAPPEPSFASPAPDPIHTVVPWENARGPGRIGAFFATIWRVLSTADAFFTSLSPSGKGHFSFAWLLVVLTGYVQLLYEAFFVAIQNTLLGGLEPETLSALSPRSLFLLGGILLPAFVALSLVIEALLNHAVLLVINRAREPFGATLRAKCYANAPMILSVVPLLGPIFAWVGVMLASIVALRRIHRIGTGAAIVAYFLPIVLWFCFLVFLAAFFLFYGATRELLGTFG
jgi:hypothetical protein